MRPWFLIRIRGFSNRTPSTHHPAGSLRVTPLGVECHNHAHARRIEGQPWPDRPGGAGPGPGSGAHSAWVLDEVVDDYATEADTGARDPSQISRWVVPLGPVPPWPLHRKEREGP